MKDLVKILRKALHQIELHGGIESKKARKFLSEALRATRTLRIVSRGPDPSLLWQEFGMEDPTTIEA